MLSPLYEGGKRKDVHIRTSAFEVIYMLNHLKKDVWEENSRKISRN